MRDRLLETKLIEHCSPTLAGLKSAGLFSYFFQDRQEVYEELCAANALLNERGVYVEAMIWRTESVLVYVYRPKKLQVELSRQGVMDLLERYGYEDDCIDNCVRRLKKRIQKEACFPHEIGLFLGYPLEDVEGFIKNKGRNCESCGMWKVYCNAGEKQLLFAKFKKCTEVYKQVFGEGRQLLQLTVAT